MTRSEAEIFQKARYLSTDDGNIFKLGRRMKEFLTDDEVLVLQSAGLLFEGDFLNASFE